MSVLHDTSYTLTASVLSHVRKDSIDCVLAGNF
jgi:hypothetical protein